MTWDPWDSGTWDLGLETSGTLPELFSGQYLLSVIRYRKPPVPFKLIPPEYSVLLDRHHAKLARSNITLDIYHVKLVRSNVILDMHHVKQLVSKAKQDGYNMKPVQLPVMSR